MTLICAKIPVEALSPILGRSFLSSFYKQVPVFLVGLRLFLRNSEKNIFAFPSRVSRAKQIDREEEKAKVAILRTDVPSSQYKSSPLMACSSSSLVSFFLSTTSTFPIQPLPFR
jgi:hypothetical protein